MKRLKRFLKRSVVIPASMTLVAGLSHPIPAADGVLSDPVVMGAWLYQGRCLACHSEYGSERLGEEYDSVGELAQAVAREGCQVSWSRQYGGPLQRSDISALARFMMKWEALDGSPELPELPPQPVEKPISRKTAKTAVATATIEPEVDPLQQKIESILTTNPLAHGGWLYTRQCYRCHLDYSVGRMSRGMTVDALREMIVFGKVGTQMTPFSNLQGGDLSGVEIAAIVNYIVTWEKFGEPPALPDIVMSAPEDDPSMLVPVTPTRFPAVQGDIASGRRVFARNCVRCHGQIGEGYIGSKLNGKRWVIREDLMLKSIIKEGVPSSLMPAWSINGGGDLEAREIDDLVALIQDWSKQ